MTLKRACDENITDFNHICIDGTIKKAFNSKNVINKKEVRLSINNFNGLEMSEDNRNELHKPALKILKRDIDVVGKLELFYDIETQFTFSEQNIVSVNDIEARWIKNKKENSKISL